MTGRSREEAMARLITTLLILCAVSLGAFAQSATTLTLGQSLLPLNGPWKFQIGDSPLDPSTGQPLWAQPNFDDSGWETVNLDPGQQVNYFSGTEGYQPGWSQKGHPGYSGYAWYRIRVMVHANPGQKLALGPPRIFDDAYQYFLNGSLIGSFGDFHGARPTFYYEQPKIFPLPPIQGSVQVIAFRMWASPASIDLHPDAGGLHIAPLLGTADAVAAQYQLGWLQAVRDNAVWAFTGFIYLLIAAVAFALFLLNRTDRVYLWMGIIFFLMSLGGVETALASWTQLLSAPAETWICNVLVLPLLDFAWVMLFREWFQLERPRWLPLATGLLTLAQALFLAAGLDLLSPLVSFRLLPDFLMPAEVMRFVLGGILTWLIVRGILRFGLEGWLLLPGVLLAWAGRLLRIPLTYEPFGIYLSLQQITGFLLALAMCALLVRRWIKSSLAQRQMTLEMKQAQEVQQVLIPDAVPQIPGFSIQSVYLPAGQVGGDFFQILPVANGAVLLCIGDVSGKGMPAAMTVSLLVGTLRTLAHYTQHPGEILAAMNQRMLGRSRGGFTTCLVLLASPDGTVTVANAGHISPFLDNREVVVENGLPLGLVADVTYLESTFHQELNQQLTLLTDGVVEARSTSGELYGFERTAQISGQPAESIAATAEAFGQEDDITVLTLTRAAIGQSATTPKAANVLSPTLA
jgi:hypothetical protein